MSDRLSNASKGDPASDCSLRSTWVPDEWVPDDLNDEFTTGFARGEAKRTVESMGERIQEYKLTNAEFEVMIVGRSALSADDSEAAGVARAKFLARNNVRFKPAGEAELHPRDRGLLDLGLYRETDAGERPGRWYIVGPEGWIIWWYDCSEDFALAVYHGIWQALGGQDWNGKIDPDTGENIDDLDNAVSCLACGSYFVTRTTVADDDSIAEFRCVDCGEYFRTQVDKRIVKEWETRSRLRARLKCFLGIWACSWLL